MGVYETLFIVNPELNDAEVENVVQRLQEVVTRSGGQVHRTENWGRKKLAYEVKKHRKGIYVLMYLSGSGKTVAELERHYRMMDPVLRYLTVKLEKLPDFQPPEAEAAPREAEAAPREAEAQPAQTEAGLSSGDADRPAASEAETTATEAS